MLFWKTSELPLNKSQVVMRENQNIIGQPEFINKNELREEIQSFKNFAFKKNMIQLSIAMILGASFNDVVGSISNNLIMPLVNAVLAHTGSDWRNAVWQPTTNIAIEYGKFIGSFIDFLLTALVLYIVFKKVIMPIWSKYTFDNEVATQRKARIHI